MRGRSQPTSKSRKGRTTGALRTPGKEEGISVSELAKREAESEDKFRAHSQGFPSRELQRLTELEKQRATESNRDGRKSENSVRMQEQNNTQQESAAKATSQTMIMKEEERANQ